jgi:hypothetical protein
MNKAEAIKQLNKGERLKHPSFTSEEWVQGDGNGMYIFEDGCSCYAEEFWHFRTDPNFDNNWTVIRNR